MFKPSQTPIKEKDKHSPIARLSHDTQETGVSCNFLHLGLIHELKSPKIFK